MEKVCPQCQLTFETQHNWDVYCSRNCREVTKNMAYLKKWAETTPKKKKLMDHQRMTRQSTWVSETDGL